MSGEIHEVSKAIGAMGATIETILSNQEVRNRVDADFRREMRDALKLLAPSDELKKVSEMATATKARVDRAGWHLSGIVAVLSFLGIIIQNKIREWLG